MGKNVIGYILACLVFVGILITAIIFEMVIYDIKEK